MRAESNGVRVREQRALVGRDRQRDPRRRHVASAERLLEQIRVLRALDPAERSHGTTGAQRQRVRVGDARRHVVPVASDVTHLGARDRGSERLDLERAARGE
jgi:hypothetical protein